MDKILETINLHGGYGPKIKILHGVDIHVKKKEIVCIIGPNGSGKSTLVKLIYGLITHHEGKIMYYPGKEKIDLTNIKSNKMVHNDIGFVPQRNNVFPSLTIEENLEMGGFSLTANELKNAKNKIFNTYPILKERRSLPAKTLSGGQRQTLAMARALITNPKMIILDEPSAALQPNLVTEIMEHVKKLRDDLGVAVLLVEQNAKSGLAIADRGYILAAGQVVHEDTGHNLLNNTDLGSYYLGHNTEPENTD